MQLSLYELSAFIAVAETKNFRKSASSLNLTPSALSRSISGLENRLGVRLFNRTTRSVSLTEAGKHFLNNVRPAIDELSAAVDSINTFKEKPTGLIRINTSSIGGRLFLLPLVAAFMKKNPDVKFEIVTEGRLVDIVEDGYDFGMRLSENIPEDMIAIPIGPSEVRLVVVGSPSYFKENKKPVLPTDLLKHKCINLRFASGAIYKWEFEKNGQEARIESPGAITLDDEGIIIDAATRGMGLAYISEFQIQEHLKSKKLIPVLEDWCPYFPGIRLFYPTRKGSSAAVKAFTEFVQNENSKFGFSGK